MKNSKTIIGAAILLIIAWYFLSKKTTVPAKTTLADLNNIPGREIQPGQKILPGDKIVTESGTVIFAETTPRVKAQQYADEISKIMSSWPDGGTPPAADLLRVQELNFDIEQLGYAWNGHTLTMSVIYY